MSLYELADGILETHVTWDDVEADIQKTLGTRAKFGENKKATNISDMKGFMSRIALVDADWINVEEGVELPQRFIVKISSQIPIIAMSKIMKFDGEDGFGEEKLKSLSKLTRECHNREVGAYKLLTKFNHPDIPYTKVYTLKPFDDDQDLKGYIIADYVPDVHPIKMFESIPADDLVSLVRGIATFSALGETVTEEEKNYAGGPEYLDLLFGQFMNEKGLEINFATLRKAFSEEYQEKVETLIRIFWQYSSSYKRYTKIHELLGFKLVLNHGDLWQSNMIHTLDGNGKLQLKAIIDWQALSRLPAGLDLSRLLLGCLSTEDRRERGVELLKLYHETFTLTLGKELFSFQEVYDSYQLYLPMMSIMVLPGIVTFFESTDLPESEKAEQRKEVMAKAIGLLEDTLKAHDYNLKHFSEFLQF
ncbi:unnamed protein product [Caenorhabditis sp. 36 PRJEB53466]|nr:unnamed protein product [Caenorhabditis sp. 36 PRJEB53466]